MRGEMVKKKRSYEEKVEFEAKTQLHNLGIKTYDKTEDINSDISTALKLYPSKDGGNGGNIVDIKLLLEENGRTPLPVMIEVKGAKDALVKYTADGRVEMSDKKGLLSKAVKTKAVNGAIHYANAILFKSQNWHEVVAIGVNGYQNENGEEVFEAEAYYVASKNMDIPLFIGHYTDMSFLGNLSIFFRTIDELGITEAQKEQKIRDFEIQFESHLKNINQKMQDTYSVSVSHRVQLICGLIMAGLPVNNGDTAIHRLYPQELQSPAVDSFSVPTDNKRIMMHILDFLHAKKLPEEKIAIVKAHLETTFSEADLWKPIIDSNGNNTHESKLKLIYQDVYEYILPMFNDTVDSSIRMDLTGKLFNVINDWVDVPDREKNDVVLTPRVVTDLMAKLCRVNCYSYVWDYTTGTAGFLVSALKLMMEDAEQRFKESPKDLYVQQTKIRCEQLLGIEKRQDMFVLAVLNMILMGDGSSNLLNRNSLTDFDGTYEQGPQRGQLFPASVFLCNPPYSVPGKGLIFVERALSRMKSGYGAVLIQENAGSGNGGEYAKNLLKDNTLEASIHMPDIFCGKASVQTAIYLFKVGEPHNPNKSVKFIDFTNDGYARSNRKKSSSDVNFRNVDHAVERYQDIVDFIVNDKDVEELQYLTKEECFKDCITLEGNDWTVNQHKKIDLTPTEEDFMKVVSEYLAWKVSAVLKGEITLEEKEEVEEDGKEIIH